MNDNLITGGGAHRLHECTSTALSAGHDSRGRGIPSGQWPAPPSGRQDTTTTHTKLTLLGSALYQSQLLME